MNFFTPNKLYKDSNLTLRESFNLSGSFITGNSTVKGFSLNNTNPIDGLVIQDTVKFETETNTVKAFMYAAKETGFAKWNGHIKNGYAQACDEYGDLIEGAKKVYREVVLYEDDFKNWYKDKIGTFTINTEKENPKVELELKKIYKTYNVPAMGKF
jgi:hypothetical protein